MKFKFKIQQYQTDAVERTVEVFEGQPSMDSLAYRRDLGKRAAQTSFLDADIETGYRIYEELLRPKDILANIGIAPDKPYRNKYCTIRKGTLLTAPKAVSENGGE